MISKVNQKVISYNFSKVVQRQFSRNLQWITTKSAYFKDKLYHREWIIEEHAKPKIKYSRAYFNDKPIKNSAYKIDYKA